jgi:hypothetical protein
MEHIPGANVFPMSRTMIKRQVEQEKDKISVQVANAMDIANGEDFVINDIDLTDTELAAEVRCLEALNPDLMDCKSPK